MVRYLINILKYHYLMILLMKGDKYAAIHIPTTSSNSNPPV